MRHLQRARSSGRTASSAAAVAVAVLSLAASAAARGPQPAIAPAAPSGLLVTGVTAKTVGVAWNAAAQAAGYDVYLGGKRIARTTSLSYQVASLNCSTAYTISVDSYTSSGRRSGQISVSATTGPCTDTQAPTTPSGLAATSVGATSATIGWNPSSDNVGVAGYDVYVGGHRVGTTAATGYQLSGFACGTSSAVAVDAYDAAGNHSGQTSITVTTTACPDTQAPSVPTSVAVSGVGATSATLGWNPSSDNVGVAGYGVYVAGRRVATTVATSYQLTGLTCGTTSTVGVDSSDAAGNRSAQASASVTTSACTTPPPAPSGLAVTSVAATAVSIAWSTSAASAAVSTSSVAGYDVYIGGQRAGTTTGTSYQLTSLTCGTAYTVAVDAYDSTGTRSSTTTTSASTAACDSTPTLYVAVSGSDTNGCTAIAPCASFQRAYQLAQPGQVVQVGAGSYGSQRLAYDSSKTGTARVVFKPAPGASVTVASVDLGQWQYGVKPPSHVELRSMTITSGWTVWDTADDVVVRDVHAPVFQVLSASDVEVLGGDYGPCVRPACGYKLISGTNVVVDGATLHEDTSSDIVAYHTDGLFVRGCRGCAVRNSKFYGNEITNIRLQDCACTDSFGNPLQSSANVVFENDWFAAPLNADGSLRGDSIDIDTPTPGLLIRNDSFSENSGPMFTRSDSGTGASVVNNLMLNFPCAVGVTYSHNVFIPASPGWGDAPCSSSDVKVTSFGYVSTGGFDYHVTATSPAIGRGDTGNCPALDIDGDARSGRCDAGADEY
jgi:chitodextrinase